MGELVDKFRDVLSSLSEADDYRREAREEWPEGRDGEGWAYEQQRRECLWKADEAEERAESLLRDLLSGGTPPE